ncbi:hypothetical protein FHI69_08710 [Janthinobacterium lividum]|uniref:Uncharacterized protein n=1 Tax=Janthinobacterium lividum TaxID=29581 RepID=A0A5C4NSJ7_9BURK|nr:hypothetical protein FHI69_08710 [Janthinobacterium lividum]
MSNVVTRLGSCGGLCIYNQRDVVSRQQERAMRATSHPSKEQVRAYMRRREHALQPPPPPDEIRRQLAWCRADDSPCTCPLATPAGVAAQGWHLSAEMARLGTLMAIAWLMHSGVAHRKN